MKMTTQAYDAVVFDMDGVIFDSEKLVVVCWQEIASKYNIPDIEDACHECLGLNRVATKDKFLQRYGADFPYDEYKSEMSALYHSRYSGGNLPQKPGVIELLKALKNQGVKVALASSTRQQVVLAELSDGGIVDYFDSIVCGDMVSKSKPDPEIFLKACECLGVNPENAYAIEDSYNGIRAASKGGLRPIMVPDMAEPTDEMVELAEIILPSLFEVKAYLGL